LLCERLEDRTLLSVGSGLIPMEPQSEFYSSPADAISLASSFPSTTAQAEGLSLDRFNSVDGEILEDQGKVDGTGSKAGLQLFSTATALFVENHGQWADESVQYAFFGAGANVLHTDSGPVFQLFRAETTDEPDGGLSGLDDSVFDGFDSVDEVEDVVFEQTQFSVTFDGATRSSRLVWTRPSRLPISAWAISSDGLNWHRVEKLGTTISHFSDRGLCYERSLSSAFPEAVSLAD